MPRKGRKNEEIVAGLHQLESGEKSRRSVARRQRADLLPLEEAVRRLGVQKVRELLLLLHETAS
jgi:hypothetical protein